MRRGARKSANGRNRAWTGDLCKYSFSEFIVNGRACVASAARQVTAKLMPHEVVAADRRRLKFDLCLKPRSSMEPPCVGCYHRPEVCTRVFLFWELTLPKPGRSFDRRRPVSRFPG